MGSLLRSRYTVPLLAVVLAVAASSLFLPFARYAEVPDADIKNDWLIARALLAGDDPYEDLWVLSDRYANGEYKPPDHDPDGPDIVRSPRLPGALMLNVPLLVVPYDSLVLANTLFSVLCVMVTFLLLGHHTRVPAISFGAIATLLSVPHFWQVRYANVSSLVALLLVATCTLVDRGDSRLAGALLGIAVTLKTFPLILVALFLARRQWRAMGALAATLLLLNGLPLLIPTIPPSHALDAILNAGSRFAHISANMSLTDTIEAASGSSLLGMTAFAVIVGSAMMWAWRRPINLSLDSLFLVSVGILVAPVSWPHYLLAVFPFAAWVFCNRELPERARLLITASTIFALLPHVALSEVSLYAAVLVTCLVRWKAISGSRATVSVVSAARS